MSDNKPFHTYYVKETPADPLDVKTASDLKWQCLGPLCSASCCYFLTVARVFVHEIIPLAKYFPVVFYEMETDEGNRDISLCILLKVDKENNYCTYLQKGVGCVLKEKRPLACKQYPFVAAKDGGGGNKIQIRSSCPGFSKVSGPPVFTPDGQISPFVRQECVDHAIRGGDACEETRQFVDTLKKHNLIVDGQYAYKGVSVPFKLVDLQKLIDLPKEVRIDLKSKGYVDLINVQTDSIVNNLTRHIDVYLERTLNNLLV